ncbi:MAG TPA: hypothetical protein VKS60_12900 [Stellaceae bacterium]|nr:hypothetical protein [Stellaceae bacterium]
MSIDLADRPAGLMIGAASVLMTVALVFHPMAEPGSPAQVLSQIAAARLVDGIVHGTIIGLYILLLAGFARFAARLGLDRPETVLGFACLALACVAVLGATLLDGFVTPDLAVRLADADPGRIEAAATVMLLVSTAIQDLTKLALVLQAAATIAWSLPLLTADRRGTGVVGIGAGVLLLAIILGANPRLMPHLLIGVLAIQGAWNLCVAALLLGWGTTREALDKQPG